MLKGESQLKEVQMKNNNWIYAIIIAIVCLIVGMVLGSSLFKQTVTKNMNVEVPGDCEVCQTCDTPICEYNNETCAGYTTEKIVEKIVEKEVCSKTTTPNEKLENKYINDTEVLKHARVQNIFISCDKYRDRETKNGNLIGNCLLKKRTLVATETTGTNRCAVLTTSGC